MENIWLLWKKFPKGSRVEFIDHIGTVLAVCGVDGFGYVLVKLDEEIFLGDSDTMYVSGIDLEFI
jgi:hypothetical protein